MTAVVTASDVPVDFFLSKHTQCDYLIWFSNVVFKYLISNIVLPCNKSFFLYLLYKYIFVEHAKYSPCVDVIKNC